MFFFFFAKEIKFNTDAVKKSLIWTCQIGILQLKQKNLPHTIKISFFSLYLLHRPPWQPPAPNIFFFKLLGKNIKNNWIK